MLRNPKIIYSWPYGQHFCKHLRRNASFGEVHPLFESLITGNRAALARAITLSESTLERHKQESAHLMSSVLKHNLQNRSLRIGISGPPGAGKSTFIEAIGLHITELNNKLAVLAVDPSSTRSGGSLLADKTRMQQLSVDKLAYIRPSPNRGHLGGVARATNAAIQLCEAGGYNVIIVETVGAGQSEIAVANMTDLFVLLVPPGSGDELQGIKKGIVEVADMILVTKADGNLKTAARLVKTEYSRALRLLRNHDDTSWKPFVQTVSSISGKGISDAWSDMLEFHQEMISTGKYQDRRKKQRVTWLWDHVQDELLEHLRKDTLNAKFQEKLEADVRNGVILPSTAAQKLLNLFLKGKDNIS